VIINRVPPGRLGPCGLLVVSLVVLDSDYVNDLVLIQVSVRVTLSNMNDVEILAFLNGPCGLFVQHHVLADNK